MWILDKIFGKKPNPKPLFYPKGGDYIRTEWFGVEQTAQVYQSNVTRLYIHIMPVMRNGKKYDEKVGGINFYYLTEWTKWINQDEIIRLATDKEIENVQNEYKKN